MQSSTTPFLYEISKIGNSSIGFISVAEGSDLPFSAQRVYWTYFTPDDVVRGNHAHKNLQQVLVAVAGRIIIETIDGKGERNSFTLHRPNMCLYVPPMCWRTLQFSHNAVLMCVASEAFDEADYIRDYNDFLALISK